MPDAAAGPYQLGLLGPFTIRLAGQEIAVNGDKLRALLAYVALQGERPTARETLMELLWPDVWPDQAQANLRQTVYRLRSALPPGRDESGAEAELLLSQRTAVGLNPQALVEVDVLTFRRLLDEVRVHQHGALARCSICQGRLDTAVALYRGEFLADFYLADSSAFEEWAAALRADLHHQALDALSRLANLYMTQGLYSRAEPLARRQIALDPLREGSYRQLMTLLARSGRKAEALAVYEQCRRRLADELGVDPSAATRALHEQILTGDLEEPAVSAAESEAFEMREAIATGGFGVIHRAYQPSVGREVAIKVISPEFSNRPDFARRLENEARIVAGLEHPHIVPIYAFWRDDSGAYLVMRLMQGGSLKELLAAGALNHELILRLLEQIASALAAVHRHGVVHRDLKPGNILLDEGANAYLSDFGIARDLAGEDGDGSSGAVFGSPSYISPEQLRSEPVTPRSDIYSLGILLYEMLAGHKPFRAKKLPDILQQQLNDPMPALSGAVGGIPPAVDVVLARATAKRPEDRYPDVLSLATDFRLALTEGRAPRATDGQAPAADLDDTFQPPPGPSRPLFVAREAQLALLNGRLQAALSAQGQVICVSGGAGRGKTALLAEFGRLALEDNPRVLVALGSCNAYSSAGDPYLPFREILAMLTAEVEARLRAGVVSPAHARRLWTGLPAAVQVLTERGPDLIGSLLPAGPLLTRARSSAPVDAPWLAELQALVARGEEDEGQEPDPNRLVGQVTAVLQTLSETAPLLLILDDLQWIDDASAALLFHLCRQIAGRRILIACAYRADEVAAGRDGGRHPLQKVLAEIKRDFGAAEIDLAELSPAEGPAFVSALIDREPNRLDDAFRAALLEHTGGHALFTVELLRAMQERGDIYPDDDGRWVAAPHLDWRTLPPRIEGVIEERIGRLDPALQELLSVAAVEGDLFTAQVAAAVQGLDERSAWRALSRDLQSRHHLIREEEEVRLGEAYLARYRFVHTLFRQYLYDRLGRGERRLLHGRIAAALLELAGEQWRPFASALAHHFEQAGQPRQAVPYWLYLGDQARIAYAHGEAERVYELAVAELRAQGRQEEAARTLMKLGLVHTAAFQPQKAQQAYARAFTLWQPALQAAQPQREQEETAVLRLALERPSTLDPGLMGDDATSFLAAQLFEGLVRIGADQNVLPAAALRWEVLQDGTVYRFHLRPDLYWSNGRPLTAHDFVYAWRRNLLLGSAAPSGHLLQLIKGASDFSDLSQPLGIEAIDEHTLLVTLEQPAAYFPYLLAHTATFPQPREAIEQWGDAWATIDRLICNGPFQLSEIVDENNFALIRNRGFGSRSTGNIERIDCTIFPDYQQALEAYSRDELEAVSLLNASPDSILFAFSRFPAEMVTIPRLSTLYLNFRCDQPPFDDRRVRQAFAHAVDKQELVDMAFQGLRVPAGGGFIPRGMSGYTEGLSLPFDPSRARELLAAAGYGKERPFPQIEWVAPPGGESVLSFLRDSWILHLGLDLLPETREFGRILASFDNSPANMTLFGWGADFPDPANVLRTPFHSEGNNNMPRWNHRQFDELTDKAEHVLDNEERISLYRRADAILVSEETAIVPLTYGQGLFLVKPALRLESAHSIMLPLSYAQFGERG